MKSLRYVALVGNLIFLLWIIYSAIVLCLIAEIKLTVGS